MPTEYLFTDDGRMTIGTLADWAQRWRHKPGHGHRGMSYYLLSWNGDTPATMHYIKIIRSRGAVRITANGVEGFVLIDEKETP